MTHGTPLWIAGGAVMLAQAAIVVLIAGRWRSLGGLLVAVVTLGVVAAVAMPADGWRERARGCVRRREHEGERRPGLGRILRHVRAHDRRSRSHPDHHRR
jgi:hypothetical protein